MGWGICPVWVLAQGPAAAKREQWHPAGAAAPGAALLQLLLSPE